MVTWSQDILLGYLVDELGARLAYRLMEAGVVLPQRNLLGSG